MWTFVQLLCGAAHTSRSSAHPVRASVVRLITCSLLLGALPFLWTFAQQELDAMARATDTTPLQNQLCALRLQLRRLESARLSCCVTPISPGSCLLLTFLEHTCRECTNFLLLASSLTTDQQQRQLQLQHSDAAVLSGVLSWVGLRVEFALAACAGTVRLHRQAVDAWAVEPTFSTSSAYFRCCATTLHALYDEHPVATRLGVLLLGAGVGWAVSSAVSSAFEWSSSRRVQQAEARYSGMRELQRIVADEFASLSRTELRGPGGEVVRGDAIKLAWVEPSRWPAAVRGSALSAAAASVSVSSPATSPHAPRLPLLPAGLLSPAQMHVEVAEAAGELRHARASAASVAAALLGPIAAALRLLTCGVVGAAAVAATEAAATAGRGGTLRYALQSRFDETVSALSRTLPVRCHDPPSAALDDNGEALGSGSILGFAAATLGAACGVAPSPSVGTCAASHDGAVSTTALLTLLSHALSYGAFLRHVVHVSIERGEGGHPAAPGAATAAQSGVTMEEGCVCGGLRGCRWVTQAQGGAEVTTVPVHNNTHSTADSEQPLSAAELLDRIEALFVAHDVERPVLPGRPQGPRGSKSGSATTGAAVNEAASDSTTVSSTVGAGLLREGSLIDAVLQQGRGSVTAGALRHHRLLQHLECAGCMLHPALLRCSVCAICTEPLTPAEPIALPLVPVVAGLRLLTPPELSLCARHHALHWRCAAQWAQSQATSSGSRAHRLRIQQLQQRASTSIVERLGRLLSRGHHASASSGTQGGVPGHAEHVSCPSCRAVCTMMPCVLISPFAAVACMPMLGMDRDT